MSILMVAAAAIACVGFPLARLVDRLRRNALLSGALRIGGLATSLAGLTQHFWQIAVCRMAVGGGSASLMAFITDVVIGDENKMAAVWMWWP